VYFIAEFIEERSGVPVTEEGCYQFCDVSPHPLTTKVDNCMCVAADVGYRASWSRRMAASLTASTTMT
jgi:hypothetical protein